MKRQKGNGLIEIQHCKVPKLEVFNVLQYNFNQLKLSDIAQKKFYDLYNFQPEKSNFELEDSIFKQIKKIELRYSINECLNNNVTFNKNLVRLLGSDCEFSARCSDVKPIFSDFAEIVNRNSQANIPRLSRQSDYEIQSSYNILPTIQIQTLLCESASIEDFQPAPVCVQSMKKQNSGVQRQSSLTLQPLRNMNFDKQSSESQENEGLRYYQTVESSDEQVIQPRPSSSKPKVKGPLGMKRNK